ncbi:hypothetical protein MUO83_03025 [Candidatus Bathyarchaeota archaeon]|nr:hypothetical protein [Candidatus Bathyarchaeota archaeon]
MICCGKYVFRSGRIGDKSASGWTNPEEPPVFVLQYDGKQIGAAHGSQCSIVLIEVFIEDKGHGTKFIELWETYARTRGFKELEMEQVLNDKLEHILEKKRGFSLKEIDACNEKTYYKLL